MGEEVTARRAVTSDNSNDDNTARFITFLIDPQVMVFSFNLYLAFTFGTD